MVENYSFDGSGNNAPNSVKNSIGTSFIRLTPTNFGENGAPTAGPNPRVVSNMVVAGNGTLEGPPFAGMVYAWGQFIDHDLDLGKSDGVTDNSITVPKGDPQLEPGSKIAQTRITADPSTGNTINHVTGWLDASMVYGSDAKTAVSLRAGNGRLATSEGNNLPIVSDQFVGGDIRANENPDLAALQVLMVREHNTWADYFHGKYPDWDSDKIYNSARAVVTGELQNITFYEFLPLIVGKDHVTPYRGYNASVDPTITQEFAGAAYRFGHSIVSETVSSVTNKGDGFGARNLAEAFFEKPEKYVEFGGTDGILRHLAADISQKMDIHIVEALRNFLNDPPASQDLAALNISRGRDMGLAYFNQTRAAFGLEPYTSFDQITSDREVAANLKKVYGSVDKVDLWTGGLAEESAPGALVGTTFQAIIAQQFEALRDGDAKWFENQHFSPEIANQIRSTTMSQIVMRNTDTAIMQHNAFLFADRHASDVSAEHPDAPQLVIGIDDDNTIIEGGEQDDTIVAGLGRNQTLRGLGGNDRFVFMGGGHDATITDFEIESDKVDFELSPGDFGLLHITATNDGSALITKDDNAIKLAGVAPDQLSAADFVFNEDRSSILPVSS